MSCFFDSRCIWQTYKQERDCLVHFLRILINNEPQGGIAKNLRCDELLYYTFIIHSAGKRIFNIGEHLAKLWAKSLTVSYTHSPCTFVLKDADLAR